jgi:hypothetical protein
LPYYILENPPEIWNTMCAEPGDVAYDSTNGTLYWVERNGEEPLIHVYSVQEPQCCNDEFRLDVGVVGGGSVTSEPAGVDCGADCQEVYLEGSVVALHPTPWTDGAFDRWAGHYDCEEGAVTMYSSRSCTAHFSCPNGSELTVSNTSITGTESVDHCNRVIVGSSVVVEEGGELTIRAGKRVVFVPPVQIDKGARLRVLTASVP